MKINYRVYAKAAAHSPWHDTGIIESDREVANKVWTDIIKSLRYHAFKLEWCTYGVAIERSKP
jgi:hypothetical protein